MTLRRELYGLEIYPFVIWWVFSIDTHSVLTGSGRGDFAETMLAGNTLPSLSTHGRASMLTFPKSPNVPHDNPELSVLDFHRIILALAARLGLLARDLRQILPPSRGRHAQVLHAEITQRRQKAEELRHNLRDTWNTQASVFESMGYGNDTVPIESRGIFEHVSQSIQ